MDHWYTGWKLWPDPPSGPVGAAFRQHAWIRPYRPGPFRILATGVGALLVLVPGYSSAIALFSTGVPLLPRLAATAALALIAVGLAIVVARFFAAGVYVNDSGIRIVSMRGMLSWSWAEVADVSNTSARVALLGLPGLRVPGRRMVVTSRDHGPLATGLTSRSPDFLGRVEAYDMAALALERWWRDAGRADD